ncbi:bifunctional biotin--[acetyl-CoA-carboxylase] synthetase/biotin operon repressor [Pseudidiomarina aestuarii]|uniref:Bifunctional ligase/repressor BirA n=2 Tax=Pseudidiomarina aestuarii TaxID=624146 RepID=A0A2T4D0V6_9GAMM|nr:bifunctional biotin--[acetyl-CoA-carboxylase] synthetase/biotin operon repressor [Pseudidiomarina aestuarii]PTB88650.1 bifunctional biotin--[acetyl-CoA-carboxylase] synthetase/biotin operon repressor [Pseudidiomarina aestuarii]PTB90221.1 bifunctional biotin--[acetyl-CoA-carboxylase] synthetase/biotin operon repressor [Pseudidiomarina aestuarii]
MTQKQEQTLVRLIEILSDGQFHSGTQIGAELNLSRAAINQYIKKLSSLGLDVYSVTGRGYRFNKPLQLLDEAKLAKFLDREGDVNMVLERIVGSSNDVLKAVIKQTPQTAGFAVVAEAQTAGRGRRGRSWSSPFGTNLYLSMYWPLENGMSQAMGLSVAIGTAIAKAFAESGIQAVQLKWPNDVLIEKRKIAGILVELEGQATGPATAIIGIGVNLSMPEWAARDIEQPWIDLEQALGGAFDRNEWVARIITAVREALMIYQNQGIKPFRESWNQFDAYQNQAVKLLMGTHAIRGVAVGIDEQGALLLKRDGKIEAYHAGEVSLRNDEATSR